ncbi:MAG: hypothetical protein V1738_01670 [Patescibacteria group bacterium]
MKSAPRKNGTMNLNAQRGFSILLAMVFLSLVSMLGFGMMNYVTSGVKVAKRYEVSVATMQIAEAGIQKALYCMNASTGSNCGGQYGESYSGESNLALNDGSFTISVAGSENERHITSIGIGPTGESSVVKVKLVRNAAVNTETSFTNALMAVDGAVISNNAVIRNGDIYSDANLTCGNNAAIGGNVYISLPEGKLDNCDVQGDAYADKIEDSDIEGDCYYDSYWVRSSCDGTRHSGQDTPPLQDLPTFDQDFWHAQAEAGGTISGNYSPPDNSTLGPAKIVGNLTLGNNRDVIMLGPIWVTGNITLSNNATITLDEDFGDQGSVLMADGTVNLSNNSEVNGTGEDGSYIIIYTPSSSSPAITVSNNAGTAVYLAPNGRAQISNNAEAIAVAARYVTLSNNAVIDFDQSGVLTELEMSIESSDEEGWQVEPGSWREL